MAESPFAGIARVATVGADSAASPVDVTLSAEDHATIEAVATRFRLTVPRALNAKDSIEYHDSFTGEQAVTTIVAFLPSGNRQHALFLGRALEKTRVFHHCTWEKRLEDSADSLYVLEAGRRLARQKSDRSDKTFATTATLEGSNAQLSSQPVLLPRPRTSSRVDPSLVFANQQSGSGHIPPPLPSPEQIRGNRGGPGPDANSAAETRPKTFAVVSTGPSPHPGSAESNLDEDEEEDVSPDVRARQWELVLERLPALISKLTSVEREATIVHDHKARMWIESVPPSLFENLPSSEVKRQEAIFELVSLQREFAEDLRNVKRIFIDGLRDSRILALDRIEEFLQEVFVNIEGSLLESNVALSTALLLRQSANPVVPYIGDVLLTPTARRTLEAFAEYGKGQGYVKYWLDQERMWNRSLVTFIESRSRLPELRRLPLESFLARPSTHLGRFPLLISAILKYSEPDSPDCKNLEQFSNLVKEKLVEINKEAGRAGNWVKLRGLVGSLEWRNGDLKDLRLLSSKRELVRSGTLAERRGTTGREVTRTVYLLDNLILITTEKADGGWKVNRKPLMLEFTTASVVTDAPTKQYFITLVSNVRPPSQLTLFGSNVAEVESWKTAIEHQKIANSKTRHVFKGVPLPGIVLPAHISLNTAAVVKNGLNETVVLGGEAGVFAGTPAGIVKCMEKERVTSLEVFDNESLVAMVSAGSLWVYPLSCVTSPDTASARKAGKQVSSNSTFIRAGVCDGKILLCSVRSDTYQSIVKAYEPTPHQDGGAQRGVLKFFGGGSKDMLKLYKDFYVPAEAFSVHFLKSKLCVGCRAGFELVDLSTLETRGLLDPNDESVEFVRNKESLRPLGLFRLPSSDVFLCYDNFGFFVNRHGARTRSDELIRFSGNPTAYSYSHPYLIAFDPLFIEIWSLSPEEPSELVQVISLSGGTALMWGEGRDTLYSEIIGDKKVVKRLDKLQASVTGSRSR